MKVKHLIIVSLVLAIVAIGAVSASEDIAADDAASDDTLAVDDVDVIADPGDEGDGDDDVIIDVPDGDTIEYDLDDNSDLSADFATVKVSKELQGNITVSYDDNDETHYAFNKAIDDIDNKKDDESGEFVIYGITFNDLDNLAEFKTRETFEIAFIDDEGADCGSEEYTIDYDEDDNVIKFWNANEETDPQGDKIDAIFLNGNSLTNDTIVIIPKDNLPEEFDNEVDVVIKDDEGEDTVQLNLAELYDAEMDAYLITVSDLFEDSIKEEDEYWVVLLVQFYNDDGDGVCYAQSDEDGIKVYTSPFVYDDVNTYEDSWVISFYEMEDADDDFNVTISKDGNDDVRQFKISELENVAKEDDEPVQYAITWSDLKLEAGEYTISVNFTKNGEAYLGYSADVNVSDELEITAFEPDDGQASSEIRDVLFAIDVAEGMEGYVNVFVDGVQVGDNITFDDLAFGGWGVDKGRQLLLNDFKITGSGTYNLKVDVYDKNDQLLNSANATIPVEVGQNSVKFNDIYFTDENCIEFNLGSPVDGYFIIYLNGEAAGTYHIPDQEIEWYDDFVYICDNEYARFLKVGEYEANITLFDGVDETDFATGLFLVNSLGVTTDKDEYHEGDNITISFEADDFGDKYAELTVKLITRWRLMDQVEEEIIVLSGDELKGKHANGVFTVNIGSLDVGNNTLWIFYRVADNKGDFDDENFELDGRDLIIVSVVEAVAPAPAGNGSNSGQGQTTTQTQTTTQAQTPVKDVIKLTLKKVKVKKSAKKLVLRATLKINGKKVKGKVVKFKFNGKTYKAKTNKKGVAKVTIKKKVLKKLKVGKKVKYQVSYGGKTVKRTVKVKK